MTAMKPHIVFITTDTQDRDMLSCFPGGRERAGVATPHLDAFADRAVRFHTAITPCPLCTPARTSWHTGLPPHHHGALGNGIPLRRDIPFVAERLNAAGYQSHHFGKWHVGADGYYQTGSGGGFDPETWYGIGEFMDEVGRDGPNRFGGWNRGFEDPEYCLAHRITDRALATARERVDQGPLYLCVEYDEPHGPYICPPPYRGSLRGIDLPSPPWSEGDMAGKPSLQRAIAAGLRERWGDGPAPYYRHYYECNAYVDSEIGRLTTGLSEMLGENVLMIFTSDHGDHLGQFGLGPKGPTLYDTTIRVPLLVRSPGAPSGGADVRTPVSLLDVVATMLDFGGADPVEDRAADGQSLRMVLTDPQRTEPVRDAAFAEYHRFGRGFDAVGGFYPIRGVRTEDWKLVINLLDRDELYDLRNDPHERENRIDDPACTATRDELHDRILKRMDRQQDDFRGRSWAERPWRTGRSFPVEPLSATGWRDRWEVDHFTAD